MVTEEELLVFHFTARRRITLIWGVVLVAGGLGLVTGREWARWTGIAIVGLSAVAQAAFLAAFPFWSVLVIALCVLVLFALAARWDVPQADMRGTVSGGGG